MRMTIEETNEYFINLMNDFIQDHLSNYDYYTYTDEYHKEERESQLINENEEDRIDRLREEIFNNDLSFGSSHDDVSDDHYLQLLVYVCKESKDNYGDNISPDKFLKREEIIQLYAYFLSCDDRVKWVLEQCMITMK